VHKYQDVFVHGEVYVPVRHCLLGAKPTSSASGLSHITKLYSHPQAWGQCKRFLGEHFRGVERQDVSSTSRAAELVAAEGPGSTSAAVSSIMAAATTGLDVLSEGIEDVKGNATRFLVLRRRPQSKVVGDGLAQDGSNVPIKSLVTFTLHQHGSPGALAECLAVFSQHSLSLTSISTRPSGEASWHYIFLVEFLAQRQQSNSAGGTADIEAALAALGQVAKAWRWVGSWDDELP
jgi:prephenate dehydratase